MNPKRFIMKQKVRFQRGQMYLSLAGAGMLLLVSDLIARYLNIPIWVVWPIGFLAVYTIGYLDDKLGFLAEEGKYNVDRNPHFSLIKKLREVKKE